MGNELGIFSANRFLKVIRRRKEQSPKQSQRAFTLTG